MGFYMLKQDMRIEGQPVALAPEGVDIEKLIDGKELPDPGPLKVKLTPGSGEFRGVLIGGSVTLFHRKFIEILASLNIDNFQAFGVDLETPDGTIQTAYSLINVIGLIEAVDLERSVIKPRATGGRGQLYSFEIDPEKAGDRQMFRIVEAPTMIIIDQALHDAMYELGLPGFIAVPTDRYDGWG